MSPNPPVTVYVTPMEHQVLAELLTDGASNDEIKKRLDLSVDTVKTHLNHVFQKVQKADPTYRINRTRLAVLILRGHLEIRQGRALPEPEVQEEEEAA